MGADEDRRCVRTEDGTVGLGEVTRANLQSKTRLRRWKTCEGGLMRDLEFS
jgi:hypothetical protein